MNSRVFITLLIVFSTVHIAWGSKPYLPFSKAFTLSEFSTTPGVKVTVEPLPEDGDLNLSIIGYTEARPIKKVTFLLLPTGTFLSPGFFDGIPFIKNLDGSTKGPRNDLKIRLVVAGPDKAVLSSTSVVYEVASNGATAEPHIVFTFYIAADLMEHSCFMLREVFPRGNGRDYMVYLGARP